MGTEDTESNTGAASFNDGVHTLPLQKRQTASTT
jgi:hypothetical protein